MSWIPPSSSVKSFPFKKIVAWFGVMGLDGNDGQGIDKKKTKYFLRDTGEQLFLDIKSNLDGVFDDRPGEFCLDSQTWDQKYMISAACSCHLDLSWTDEHAVVFGARKIGFALDRTIVLALSHFQYQT